MPRWSFEQMQGVLNKSADMLENSKDPLDWVPGMLSLWRPPGGYTEDGWLFYKTGNYLAVPGMLLEALMYWSGNDEFPETKLTFLACCAKFWEDLLIAED